MDEDGVFLKLHMEPERPVEVSELVGALSSIAREYQIFCSYDPTYFGQSDARLLVSNVSPGSIDINLVPDHIATAATLFPVVPFTHLKEFAQFIEWLIDGLLDSSKTPGDTKLTEIEPVTIKQCDDAINIAKPIANNGGSQSILVIKDAQVVNVLQMSASEAKRIVNSATKRKAELRAPDVETAERVPMIWSRLDRDRAAKSGSSPDKALIEELDRRPKPVFFTDDMEHLKREMIEDEDNPYQKVYFVDVQISRTQDKIVSYRVIGYHGKEDLE